MSSGGLGDDDGIFLQDEDYRMMTTRLQDDEDYKYNKRNSTTFGFCFT